MSSKPFGICWCDCHTPVDDDGRRILANQWPRFDDRVALATMCVKCKPDHDRFMQTGRDWAYPHSLTPSEETKGQNRRGCEDARRKHP